VTGGGSPGAVTLSWTGLRYDVTFNNVPESGVNVTFYVRCAASSFSVSKKVERPWFGNTVWFDLNRP
jgi:hypothetical protein